MGRKGSGVEVRTASIRLTFKLDGTEHRPTLKLNGKSLAPTPANQRYAERMARDIQEKIRHGIFVWADYADCFAPPRDPQAPAKASQAAGQTAPTPQTTPHTTPKTAPKADPKAQSLADLMASWMLSSTWANSTRRSNQTACNFWTKAVCDKDGKTTLGDCPLNELKVSKLKLAWASRPTLQAKGMNNYRDALRDALAFALEDELIPFNYVDKLKRKKVQRQQPDPLEGHERDALLAHFEAKYPGQMANMITFWAWTGLRTGELFGLRWDNVDLRSGKVLICETLSAGERKATTKTNVARTITLNSLARAALQAQRQHTQMLGEAVFMNPKKKQATPWNEEDTLLRCYWRPALRAVGLRYRRPYNLRHTYATAMLMAGMNHAWCAKQMGHSVEMFQTTYTKWVDGEQNDREMARLEAAIQENEASAASALIRARDLG